MPKGVLLPPCADPLNEDAACETEMPAITALTGAAAAPPPRPVLLVPTMLPPVSDAVIAPFVIEPEGV